MIIGSLSALNETVMKAHSGTYYHSDYYCIPLNILCKLQNILLLEETNNIKEITYWNREEKRLPINQDASLIARYILISEVLKVEKCVF